MALVKLILSEDVPDLGDAGEVVTVKPGFARNYLLPQGKAILATAEKVRAIEHHRRAIAERVARELRDVRAAKDRLEQVQLEVSAQAGEEGRLFGSVTAMQVAELLAAKGFEVDRRRIDLSEPIKQIGDHVVDVKLHREVVAKVRLKVTAAE
jgi:large subunit ribosomal protein L9